MTRTVIVMARAPTYGQGKTRLARDVGRAAALRINRALQAQTLRVVSDLRWVTVLAVTPYLARHRRLPNVWPHSAVRVPQGGGDLGDRLARVMRRVRGPLVVIGTDCPEMTARDVSDLFRALGKAPVAFGSAVDGGFWGLAARRACDVTRAFRGVRWSSAQTRSDIEARLTVRFVHGRTLPDIDTIEDWRAWRRS